MLDKGDIGIGLVPTRSGKTHTAHGQWSDNRATKRTLGTIRVIAGSLSSCNISQIIWISCTRFPEYHS
jgi:hypothetical protein